MRIDNCKIEQVRELSTNEVAQVSGGINPTNGPYYPPGKGMPSSGSGVHKPLNQA